MRRPVVDPQFGSVLRSLRVQAKLSLQDLAERVLSSKTQIHAFESGKRVPSIDIVERLERVLDAQGQLKALVVYEPGVPRRTVVGSMTALAAGAVSQVVAVEALRQGLSYAALDGDHWQQIADEHASTYYTTAPTAVYDRLVVDVIVLQHQMAACPGERDLLRAGAWLSMLLAFTLTSSGQTWPARRWWDTARDLADQSGDLAVRVMTRSQDAVMGLYDGRPLTAVLDLAGETLAMAGGRVCAGTAGMLAGYAQALALSGRRVEAEATVRELEAMTEAMPQQISADQSPFGWPEYRLRHTESYVYTELGLTRRAAAAQERALELYPQTHGLQRSLVRMHRAICLIADGHIGDGLRCAAEAFDDLPSERHSQLLYEVARRVVAAVPAQERQRGGYADVRDRLFDLRHRLDSAVA